VRRDSREQTGAEVAERLGRRRDEIEQAVLARVYAVSEPPSGGGSEYLEGLRAAVSASIDYGMAGIEHGEQGAPPIPDELLAQARLAARSGVSLDTVLRRYFAGYALLEDFLIDEIEGWEPPLESVALRRVMRSQAALVDRLLAAVSEAYRWEAERRPGGTDARRSLQVERLLAGEFPDVTEFSYDFAGHHLGAVAKGPGASEALRELARSLDRRLFSLPRDDGSLWVWLGGRDALDREDLARLSDTSWPAQMVFALGEPAHGLGGWRLTHQQARAAFPIALRGRRHFVRYGDVALLAAMLQDDLLATSLRRLYLDPLAIERDGGATFRETLRAYFDAELNVSSTAAVLGITRNTVTSRLHAIEEHLGRPIGACGADLEAALRLEEFASQTSPDPPAQSASPPPSR